MTALSISGLQKQLIEKIFDSPESANTAINHQLDELEQTNEASSIQLDALRKTQEMMVKFTFQDFVNYFLSLENKSKQLTQQQASANPNLQGPLYAKPLYLDISIERYQQVGAEELTGSQPVRVQKMQTDTGLANRMEIRTPEIHSDGTVSYNITVVKMAISIEDVKVHADMHAQMTALGQPLVPAASQTLNHEFEEFLDQSPYGGEAEEIWEYANADAMDLLEEQERYDAWVEDHKMRLVIEATMKLIRYMNAIKIDAAFGLNDEEEKLIAEALQSNSAEVIKKAFGSFIRKKRVELEMVRKELKERQEAQEDSHKIAAAQDKLKKIINIFEKMQDMIDNQDVDTAVLYSLMNDLEKANTSQADTMNFTLSNVPIG